MKRMPAGSAKTTRKTPAKKSRPRAKGEKGAAKTPAKSPRGATTIGGVTIKLARLPESKKGKAIRDAVRAYYAARRA